MILPGGNGGEAEPCLAREPNRSKIASAAVIGIQAEQLGGNADRLEMNVDRVGDIVGVTTGHGYGHGQSGGTACSQDQAIALGKPVFGQSKMPVSVAREGIRTGQVDHHVRICLFEGARQSTVERLKEGSVSRPVFECDVQTASLFVKRKISRAVYRVRLHPRELVCER